MSKEPLELVHSDVCSPMSVHSFNGYSYCVTFIDDYSRKTLIYFLEAKSEVFERFQEFKTFVENQIGKKIRVVRTENGVEYTSNEFMVYFLTEGIKKEHNVPHTPQHNGVAKHKNRTMVGAAKAMLFDQGLHYSSGPRHTGLQYTFRTCVPTQLQGGRHQRKSS